jgi:hypothetical protein
MREKLYTLRHNRCFGIRNVYVVPEAVLFPEVRHLRVPFLGPLVPVHAADA